MKSKLWQAFVVASISALAVPAFVQSQTAGGGAVPGGGTSPGATGSSRQMGTTGAPSGSTSHDMESGTHGSMGSSTTPGGTHGSMGSSATPGSTASSSSMGAMSDQAKSEADRTLNRNIRQGLSADTALSASAKNVHFTTDNGKVTLQGTVPTEKDKKDIQAKVEKMTGVKDVDNQLQIAPAATTSSAAGSKGSMSDMGAPSGAGSISFPISRRTWRPLRRGRHWRARPTPSKRSWRAANMTAPSGLRAARGSKRRSIG